MRVAEYRIDGAQHQRFLHFARQKEIAQIFSVLVPPAQYTARFGASGRALQQKFNAVSQLAGVGLLLAATLAGLAMAVGLLFLVPIMVFIAGLGALLLQKDFSQNQPAQPVTQAAPSPVQSPEEVAMPSLSSNGLQQTMPA